MSDDLSGYGRQHPRTLKVLGSDNRRVDLLTTNDSLATEETTAVGEPFALYLTRVLDPGLTLTSPVSKDDKVISVDIPTATPSDVPADGHMVCLKEGTRFYQGRIVLVTPTGGTGYDLRLNAPVDSSFTVAGGCSLVTSEMATDGSITPAEYRVSPSRLDEGTTWDIHSVSIHIVSATAQSDILFGNQARLDEGFLLRSVNGFTKNLMVAHDNGDIGDYGFLANYVDSPGVGNAGYRGEADIKTLVGTTFEISSKLPEEDSGKFVALVQDDLTTQNSVHMIVRGHIVKT